MNKQQHEHITDEMILSILDAKEAGRSFPDALATLPSTLGEEDVVMLRSLFEMHGDLMRTAHNVVPDMKLLARTLEKLEGAHNVTTPVGGGSTREDERIPKNLFIRNLHLIMQMNWKIGAPIAVFALAFVTVLSMGSGGKTDPLALAPVESAGEEPTPMAMSVEGGTDAMDLTMATMPAGDSAETPTLMMARSAKMETATPVSGEVDDLAASLSLEADGDLSLLADTTADLSLLSADSQAINDFNSAYDETIF